VLRRITLLLACRYIDRIHPFSFDRQRRCQIHVIVVIRIAYQNELRRCTNTEVPVCLNITHCNKLWAIVL
jgi:hypothetical protein